MGPQTYWILLTFLVILLAIFSIYLILNIIKDICFSNEPVRERRQSHIEREMRKYNFDKHDVEDLTKLEGDFKTVVPHMKFVNEVEGTKIKSLLKGRKTLKDDIDGSQPDLANVKHKSITFLESGDRHDSLTVTGISSSVDNLEFCDPTCIDVMKSINMIETDARRINENIAISLGHLSDLKYYEINEKFIRLQIDLCDIYCDREELRKRKNEVSGYIQECQQRLRSGTINKIH